jgi:hypothetical protein
MSIGRLANTMALLVVRQGRLIDPTLHIVGDQDSIRSPFGVSGYTGAIHTDLRRLSYRAATRRDAKSSYVGLDIYPDGH